MVFSDLGGQLDENNCPVYDEAIVQIELSEKQYDQAFRRTMMWFTSKKGFIVYRPLTIIPGVTDYQMAQDVNNVLDVIYAVPDDVAAFFSLGFFDLIPYGPQSIGNLTANTSSYSGFAQLLQYNEERKRVFSVTPDWIYDQQTKILHAIYRSAGINSIALMQLKLNTFDVTHLVDKDMDLFYRYLLASSKEIVGRIRSKYDSLPSANGQVVLDGKELLAEAKEEKEMLEKELFASQGPDIPVVG